jgi:hypothetical protein
MEWVFFFFFEENGSQMGLDSKVDSSQKKN